MKHLIITAAFLLTSACGPSERDVRDAERRSDYTSLARIGLSGARAGRSARRALGDAAAWETGFRDLSGILPVLKRGVDQDEPVRLRVLDILARIADRYVQGVTAGFLGKRPPSHVRPPFYTPLIPRIAVLARTGSPAVRVAALRLLPQLLLSARGYIDTDLARQTADAVSAAASLPETFRKKVRDVVAAFRRIGFGLQAPTDRHQK